MPVQNLALRKLVSTASSIDFAQSYQFQAHREIYDQVSSIADDPPTRGGVPMTVPRAIVFYTIRNILYPTFILGQIPDLLNHLTMVDNFRQYAVMKSAEALEWNTFYSRPEFMNNVRTLAAKEVARLEHYTERAQRTRMEYVLLIRNLCLLHIHYLWTSPESCLLGKRLIDFFPGSLEGSGETSRMLFHQDLCEDEKLVIGELKEECRAWMDSVVEWETAREEQGDRDGRSKEEMDSCFKDEFALNFPPPVDPQVLAEDLERYIKKVEDMVETLEEWFGG
ncbi:hypothetical protein F5I97DRAFT_1889914 [Phlebopus sp. FC_14]|nr:hypothetical protein F5I97DRAFT_1889914 [Phlebopus sp. FC_14]